MKLPDGAGIERYSIAAPETSDRAAMKWDGEWQITYEVFRDLGIAFAVVLALIAVLVVGWFQSFAVPLAILLPIPLSLIGILPGHFLFGAFFTATSMIGFIAGAGIIVRNSIILVDFIELKLRQGMALEEAVVEAGVVRFRPMLLTAAAVVVGSFVMLFDPIFQGLAISLMMGEVAATFLSRLAVPVVYYLIARRGRAEELRLEARPPAMAACRHPRGLARNPGGTADPRPPAGLAFTAYFRSAPTSTSPSTGGSARPSGRTARPSRGPVLTRLRWRLPLARLGRVSRERVPSCSRRTLSHRLVGWCGDQLSRLQAETGSRVPALPSGRAALRGVAASLACPHVRVRPRDEVAFARHDQELAGSSGKVCPSEHVQEALSRRKRGGVGRLRTSGSRRGAP